MRFLYSVVADETSALPNVYQNSFSVGTTETNYKHECTGNKICASTVGKRSCILCSSIKASEWYNLTTVFNDNNFTASNPSKTVTPVRLLRTYSRPLRYDVIKVVTYIIPPLSLVTNSLSIAVFYRMRRKLQNELVLVFVAVSVVDTFAITPRFMYLSYLISRNLALNRYNIGCQVFKWIENFSPVCSSYLVLLYTIERFVSVRFPLKRAIICSGRRIRIAVLCIFIFAPVSQIYALVLFKHKNTSCGIPSSNKRTYSKLKTYNQFLIGIFLPYGIVAILNTMIVYNLAKYRKKNEPLSKQAAQTRRRKQTDP